MEAAEGTPCKPHGTWGNERLEPVQVTRLLSLIRKLDTRKEASREREGQDD